MENKKRSLVKTISWRSAATLVTFGFIYIFTRDLPGATTLAVVINTVKALLYYVHERAWAQVKWGYIENEASINSKSSEN